MERSDCRVEVVLVVGMESAGRNSSFVRLAVKEGRDGSAGCRPGWEFGSWRRSSEEELGRTGLAGHNCLEADCIAQQPN